MMEPKHERAHVLTIAINQATSILDAPIDRLVVSNSQIICWAGARRLEMSYGYSDAYDTVSGSIKVGSGNWWVNAIGPPTGDWTRFLRRLKVWDTRRPRQ